MHTLLHEIRYAFRQLRNSPGFALVSVLTLALGIGANIAVFSVTNAILLNPSGIPHVKGLVALRVHYLSLPALSNIGISAPDFTDAADGKDIFQSAAALRVSNYNLSRENANPELVRAAQVSSEYFDVFQVQPYLGRAFTLAEDQPGAEHEVMLSYRIWARQFGSDPHIVGQSLILDRQPYRVVGVMGPEFNWPNRAELWIPLALPAGQYRDPKYRYNENMGGFARLRPGVTVERANAYLAMKSEQNIQSEGGKSYGRASQWGMFCLPLNEFAAGPMRTPLTMLLITVGMVLLIACANIVGLQIARASARDRELAVRIALGASKLQLMRQTLIESALLTAAGVGLGFAAAIGVAPLLLHYLPRMLSAQIDTSLSGPVLTFVVGIAVLCSLFCGIVPAWHRTRPGWFNALQQGGRSGSTGAVRQRLRSLLVVTQVALSLLLLAGAGLLLSSLRAAERVETGFQPEDLLSAQLSLPTTVYDKDEKQEAFYSALQQRLLAIPGVKSAAINDALPFSDQGGSASFLIEGRPSAPNDPGPHGNISQISPGYFSTMRIPLLAGRDFANQDRAGTQGVAIIDTVLAQRYWPGKNPIGEHIGFDERAKGPWYTIVGVVAHARNSSLESDTEEGVYYLPLSQVPNTSASVVVRSSRSPEDLATELAAAVRSEDPSIPIYDVKTMEQRVDESLVGRRFVVLLLTTFAGLALLLAALGLYGVISYSVRLRTREMGVRMALGAQRGEVLRLVLLQGLRLALIGVVCGALAAAALGRVFSGLLFEVSVLHAMPWIVAIGVLTATVLVASYLPARRAASIEPMRALRTE